LPHESGPLRQLSPWAGAAAALGFCLPHATRGPMRIDASLPATTLISLVEQLIPLRIELGGEGELSRYLLLSAPAQAALVDGRGVRLGCRADVCWPVLGMRLPVPLRAFRVLLLPEVDKRKGQHLLVFKLLVEHAEIAGFPSSFAGRLLEWVNQALEARDVELAWNVGDSFARSFALPRMLSTLEALDLSLSDLSIRIENQELRLSVGLSPAITRRDA
jgi:hypothetical protein